MTVECEDYLSALSFDLDERMGIAISHWDNSDGRSDFEFNYEQEPGSCDGDFSVTQIKVEIDGSNEEPEEDKEDET